MDIRKIAYGRYQLDWMAEKGYIITKMVSIGGRFYILIVDITQQKLYNVFVLYERYATLM